MNSVRIASRQFTGKVALVTGAGSGIGEAVARKLGDLGATVVLADVNADAVERVAGGVANARALTMDVADADEVDRMVGEIGRLDVVVHAAGVDDPDAKQWIADAMLAGRPPEVTARLRTEAWRRVMAVNLDGTFHVLRAAVRVMTGRVMTDRVMTGREATGQEMTRGVIVVIGSSSAFDAPTGYPHYAASKAGVHALAQAVAKEAIAFGVRVNIVAPGPTETGMAARTPAALREAFADPRVRPYATPAEIADIAVFLAGAESSNLVGAVLLANGGRFTS